MSKGGVRVVYHAKQRRESLFWLGITLFFGGLPLAIYAGAPGMPHITLVVALILGLPPFIYSLVLITQYKAFVLSAANRRFQYVEGLLEKRKVQEHGYADVARVQVAFHSDDDSAGYFVLVALKNGKSYSLEMSKDIKARELALTLATAMGVTAFERGQKIQIIGSAGRG